MKRCIAGLLLMGMVVSVNAQPVTTPEPTIIERILLVPWFLGEFWEAVCIGLGGEYYVNEENYWVCPDAIWRDPEA